jgi:signal transduction histidine kinase
MDLMRQELAGALNDDQREIADTVWEDAQRLEDLVGEMLELSRMESARMIYKFQRCSVETAIRGSVRQYEGIAARGEIALTTRVEPDLPDIWADLSKITWVLNNLLSNALKYTDAGGSVTVEAVQAAGMVQVSVTDTGVGVPPEFADQIFEKFVQIKGYDIEVRGSGVGLAAAREIITAHQGRIWCDTDRAEGSRFCFTLPPMGEEEQDGAAGADR